MIFKRSADPAKKFFFMPQVANADGVLIFSQLDQEIFDLSQAIQGTLAAPYLLIFYKGAVDYGAATMAELNAQLAAGRTWLWVDNFTGLKISAQNKILIKNYNEIPVASLGVSIGRSATASFSVNNLNAAGTVTYDAASFQLNIAAVGGTFDVYLQNGQAMTTAFTIPLTSTSAKAAGHTFRRANNLGAVCLKLQTSPATMLPQPLSPFLMPTPTGKRKVVFFGYFDEQDYTASAINFMSVKAFNSVAAAADEDLGCYLESVSTGGLLTAFVDETANKYRSARIGTNNTLVSRLVPVASGNIASKVDYFFIPQDGEALSLKKDDSKRFCLIGNSGTEALDVVDFVFRENERLLINPAGADDPQMAEYLQPNDISDSRTAFLEIAAGNYHLDSYKSPIFPNKGAVSAYEHIPKAKITAPIALPIIPTLAFKGNNDLIDADALIRKARLKSVLHAPASINQAASGTYVTPQGFLKKGSNYDFIPNMSPQPGIRLSRKARAARASAPPAFQFTITDNGHELDLSIRKDDVFLVLTPLLFKQYLQTVPDASVRVAFSANKSVDIQFIADLTGAYTPAPGGTYTHDQSIIIIKFYKDSVSNLMDVPVKWSNHGKVLGEKQAIVDMQAALKAATVNIKDDYFTKSVLTDPNWNGVCVLNVPIASAKSLPGLFSGLGANQNLLKDNTNAGALALETALAFQYVAFPINKTVINGQQVEIASTSFFGYIDYSPFTNDNDYRKISAFFDNKDIRFILSKLQVQFRNSTISSFISYAFLQLPKVFDDNVHFTPFKLANPNEVPQRGDPKDNLLLINGTYQKNTDGTDNLQFNFSGDVTIDFPDSSILDNLKVSKVGFVMSGSDKSGFRFELDAAVNFKAAVANVGKIFSFDSLHFQNIGFSFNFKDFLPKLDLSRLFVLPSVSFNGSGFLSSFPVHFNSFRCFRFTGGGGGGISWPDLDFDFLKMPHFSLPAIPLNDIGRFFSFIFDIDLGTLGPLGGLQGLKAQLVVGWSFQGGFGMGLKINGPSINGLHIDLFGALKLDIDELDLCKVGEQFIIRIINARLTIFGLQLPKDADQFSAIIFAQSGQKTAWLASYTSSGKLTLGVGQRVALRDLDNISNVAQAVDTVKALFKPQATPCPTILPAQYAPDSNWLIASEKLLPDNWPVELSFIFNDPRLYGIHLGVAGFVFDILYKKLSDNLGVYAADIQLPDSLRNYDTGGAYFRLPNLGIQIFTNGSWKLDIGFPANSNDWSRSGFLQLRTAPPFVGWFGFYLGMARTASITLFGGLLGDTSNLNILQFGIGMRVGLGAYIDGGIFYAGASISIYGILEGAAAFKKGGIAGYFPEHFAVQGRIGAIAEIVGYVDFGILKAGVYISLRAEFGFLLIYLGEQVNGHNKGIQPVKVYIEGDVRVRVSIKIGCVKIHLSFGAHVRFEYVIGGGGSRLRQPPLRALLSKRRFVLLPGTHPVIPIPSISDIPVIYMPVFTSGAEFGATVQLVHTFMIPFFGNGRNAAGGMTFSATNILKDRILKPFFQDLLKVTGPVTYDNLKLALNEADFQVPNYRPTIIKGLNGTGVDDLLKKEELGFGFTDAELLHGGTVDNILSNYADYLRLIPCPASAALQIVDGTYNGNDNPLYRTGNGFEVRLKALANNLDGSSPVTQQIGPVTAFTQADLDYMTTVFNNYKTQFDNRQSEMAAKRRLLPLVNPDFRQTVVIPEFFTLAALLTLERLYHNPEIKRSKTGEAPVVLINGVDNNGIFHYTVDGAAKTWNPNDNLEDLSGQLNYFYNSGLRLPDKAGIPAGHAVLQQLGQVQEITVPSLATRVAADVVVSISGQDITREVFAGPANVKEMWMYMDGFTDPAFNPAILKNEFVIPAGAGSPITIAKPFELIPVTLSVANSKRAFSHGAAGIAAHFFEIPPKLRSEAKSGSHTAFAVNCADRSLQQDGKDQVVYSTNAQLPGAQPLSGMSRTLNVELKVRIRAAATLNTLEIVGVAVEDLNLIRLLHTDGFRIDTAGLFFKPAAEAAVVRLEDLAQKPFSLLKANLSSHTAPPAMDLTARRRAKARAAAAGPAYYASSADADLANLVRLAWEGLTTNNGGYFLILGTPVAAGTELADSSTTHTVILSLGTTQQAAPTYFNYFTLDTAVVGPLLDANKCYLYLDQLSIDNKPVLEYHPTIPVHTMGFALTRDLSITPTGGKPYSDSNYNKYYPLEFGITGLASGSFRLSNDEVLPVMPSTADGAPNLLYYQHVSPLIKVTDAANLDRYAAVGQQFRIDTALRDIFGIRAGARPYAIATVNYQHLYNDKLIPADAWPLCRFGYWCNTKITTQAALNLRQTVDLLSILDLAGIPRKQGDYKYDYGAELEAADAGLLLDLLKGGLLDKVNSILAQLQDAQVKVSVSYYTGEAIDPAKGRLVKQLSNLKKQLADLAAGRQVGGQTLYFLPPKPLDPLDFALALPALTPDIIKAPLNVNISLTRPNGLLLDGRYPELVDNAAHMVWEYQATAASVNPITPAAWANPGATVRRSRSAAARLTVADPDSTLEALNDALEKYSKGAYTLGLSSDKQTNAKTTFLINRTAIASIRVNPATTIPGSGSQPATLKAEPCYFGIKPFSNRLWSGAYQPSAGPAQLFADVDLDGALQLVLTRIETLAQPDMLSANFPGAPDLFEQLMTAKKRLVNSRLRAGIAWAADTVNQPEPDTGMVSEFNDLLLRDLNNFYAFDGLIGTQIDSGTLDLSDYRLTVALAAQDGYSFVSSKLGYHYLDDSGRPVSNQSWYVLFDQLGNAATLDFTLTPTITHIEYDLQDDPDSHIAGATWIQLIRPVGLAQPAYRVKGWNRITRGFPPKPVILQHQARQASPVPANWDIRTAGLWNYELELQDLYTGSDRLLVEIELATTATLKRLATGPDLSAFIAYWAAVIADPDHAKFKWQDFITELIAQFPSRQRRTLSGPRVAGAPLPSFTLVKTNTGAWQIKDASPGLPVKLTGTGPHVLIGPFDVFQANARILSVLPQVKAIRNSLIPNPEFLFQTATVQPVTPAVPHISYPDPMPLKPGNSFQAAVFQNLAQMPFRATARFWVKPGNQPPARGERLPIIPVQQFECPSGNNIPDPDAAVFARYRNGFSAYTLIVYNHDGSADADLPVLYAETIVKP